MGATEARCGKERRCARGQERLKGHAVTTRLPTSPHGPPVPLLRIASGAETSEAVLIPVPWDVETGETIRAEAMPAALALRLAQTLCNDFWRRDRITCCLRTLTPPRLPPTHITAARTNVASQSQHTSRKEGQREDRGYRSHSVRSGAAKRLSLLSSCEAAAGSTGPAANGRSLRATHGTAPWMPPARGPSRAPKRPAWATPDRGGARLPLERDRRCRRLRRAPATDEEGARLSERMASCSPSARGARALRLRPPPEASRPTSKSRSRARAPPRLPPWRRPAGDPRHPRLWDELSRGASLTCGAAASPRHHGNVGRLLYNQPPRLGGPPNTKVCKVAASSGGRATSTPHATWRRSPARQRPRSRRAGTPRGPKRKLASWAHWATKDRCATSPSPPPAVSPFPLHDDAGTGQGCPRSRPQPTAHHQGERCFGVPPKRARGHVRTKLQPSACAALCASTRTPMLRMSSRPSRGTGGGRPWLPPRWPATRRVRRSACMVPGGWPFASPPPARTQE